MGFFEVGKVGQNCLLFNVIDPLVEYIVQKKNIKNIGVIGTKGTTKSKIYPQKLQSLCISTKPISASISII